MRKRKVSYWLKVERSDAPWLIVGIILMICEIGVGMAIGELIIDAVNAL